MLTAEQHTEFDERGIVRLHDVFSNEDASRMRTVVWSELEHRYGALEHDPSTWTPGSAHGMKTSRKSPAFAPIGAPALFDAIDELLGAGSWKPPAHWGQVMVTFPEPHEQWVVPSKQWHADWAFTSEAELLFGLKVFAFFGDVAPQGGGTLVVTGSHRIVERFVPMTSVELRSDYRACRQQLMQHDPWLRALARADDPDPDRNERFMAADHDADGVPVRVVELTGHPGEVVIAHPWILHHAASNVTSYPRMMRGRNLQRRWWSDDYVNP